MNYCDVFIRCLDSHSDGTAEDALVSKWCNATFLQIFLMKKEELIYILDGLRVSTFSSNYHFWMSHSFKALVLVQLGGALLISRRHQDAIAWTLTIQSHKFLNWSQNVFNPVCSWFFTVHMYTEHPRADTNLSRLNGVRDDERGEFVQTHGRRLK